MSFRFSCLRCCLAASSLLLLPAAGAAREFFARTWLVDQGLPHDGVNRIVQDQRGYLWTATIGGLARFDGLDFREYPHTPPSEDAGLNIRDLVRAPDGSLALIAAGSLLLRLTEAGYTPHPASDALRGRALVRLFPEADGSWWFGTFGSEVLRWDATTRQLVRFGPAEGFTRQSGEPYSWAHDNHGHTWVASGPSVGRYRDGKFAPLPLPGSTDIVIAAARTGGVWIASSQSLAHHDGTRVVTACDPSTWRATYGEIEHLFEDRDGALWIGTRRAGLWRWSSGLLERVLALPHAVTDVMQDEEGNIWVASDGGGLARVRPQQFQLLDATAGFPADISLSVCEDAQGALWCANRSGLLRWRDGRVTLVTVPGLEDLVPNLVCADQSGWVWFSGGGALHRVRGDDPDHLERVAEPGPVFALFCARNGDMWASLEDGELGYYRDGEFQTVPAPEAQPARRVGGFTETSDGTLWVAMHDDQLFAWRGGQMVRDSVASDTIAGRIHVLHGDRRGQLWLGTSRGLVLRQEGRFTVFTRADGLLDDIIDQILEDDQGHLWLGSRRGLFRVALDALYSRADGGTERVHALALGPDDGITGTSSLRDSTPGAWKARDGRLWFTTNRGVVGLDPGIAGATAHTPRVYVEDVIIDRTRVPATSLATAGAGPTLHLGPGVRQVQFRFTALHFSAPEKVTIRHRLEGLDPDWIALGGRRSASYARLPPGAYTLHVTALTPTGDPSSSEATLAVIVAPAWWQTWWARAGGVLAFSLVAGGLGRAWALRRIRARLERLERAHALAQERTRIARDLHDELGGNVTRLGLLAERLKRRAAESTVRDGLDQLATLTRRLTGDLESVVWAVSPKNDSWDRLAIFIGQLAPRFFRDTDIRCSVEGIPDIPAEPLAPEAQHHVLSIVKEALNNALRHARATRIALHLAHEAGDFVLRLEDDGVGFDPRAPEHAERNGLNNMHHRVHELGGTLTIDSAPGRGAHLVLRVPLRAMIASRAT